MTEDSAQTPKRGTNSQISYTSQHIKRLEQEGILSEGLSKWLFKFIAEENERKKEIETLMLANKSLKLEVLLESFSAKLLKSRQNDDMEKIIELFDFLLQYKEKIIPEALHSSYSPSSPLFKSIGPDEFGISRMMADPLNNVPRMLDTFSEPVLIKEEKDFNVYMIESKSKNSRGETLRLTHRFRANDHDEAGKHALAFVQRITGRQKKVFEACWAMANKKMLRSYTCALTELMEIAYPNRKGGAFWIHEKVEFYQDLLDLSDTQLMVEPPELTKKKKQEVYHLPFITLHKTTQNPALANAKESEKYPNDVTISVLHNPVYESERSYFVGAGIKISTLELHNDDIQLAEYIQIRKNQQMKEEFIFFTDRKELMKYANLSGTTHSGMANKRLMQKLQRLKEKGIILDYSKKMTLTSNKNSSPFWVRIRENQKKA